MFDFRVKRTTRHPGHFLRHAPTASSATLRLLPAAYFRCLRRYDDRAGRSRESGAMETTRHTPETTRNDTGTARSPAVVATLSALLLLAASIAVQIAAGADYPSVPPGLVIPLVVAGLVAWRTNRWTTGLALGVGLFIGTGAILTPNTGDHRSEEHTSELHTH